MLLEGIPKFVQIYILIKTERGKFLCTSYNTVLLLLKNFWPYETHIPISLSYNKEILFAHL